MEVRPSATDILRASALATGIAELSEALNFVEPIDMLDLVDDLDGLNDIGSSGYISSDGLTLISFFVCWGAQETDQGSVESEARERVNDDDRHRDVVIPKDVGDRNSDVDDNADGDIDDDMISMLATTLMIVLMQVMMTLMKGLVMMKILLMMILM